MSRRCGRSWACAKRARPTGRRRRPSWPSTCTRSAWSTRSLSRTSWSRPRTRRRECSQQKGGRRAPLEGSASRVPRMAHVSSHEACVPSRADQHRRERSNPNWSRPGRPREAPIRCILLPAPPSARTGVGGAGGHWCRGAPRLFCLVLVHLERGDEGLLWDLHLAELAHPLLALLLFFKKLALARDVAAIALGEHVL